MSHLHNNRSRFQRLFQAVAILAMLTSVAPASAETVEVAPGVQVTKRTYSAPSTSSRFSDLS